MDAARLIWGHHFHVDVPSDETQLRTAALFHQAFITAVNLITRTEVYRPGYGPHQSANFEIRLEKHQTQTSPQPVEFTTPSSHFSMIAWAAVWASLNRGPLSVGLHPVTHNDFAFDLVTEGIDHRDRALWLNDEGQRSDWNPGFFFSPPLIKIDPANPHSQVLVKRGLPQKEGYVLEDTRAITRLDEDAAKRLLQGSLPPQRTPKAIVRSSIRLSNRETCSRLLAKYSELLSEGETIRLPPSASWELLGQVIAWLMMHRRASTASFQLFVSTQEVFHWCAESSNNAQSDGEAEAHAWMEASAT